MTTTTRLFARSFAAIGLAASLGCDRGPTQPRPTLLPVLFSGTIEIKNGTTIPSNARVLVVWTVSAGSPDYSYVFGNGILNPVDKTFSLSFATTPPSAAINASELGVGLLVITTDETLVEGKIPDGYTWPGLIGMSVDHSIIFTEALTDEQLKSWPGRFNGFGAGVVERNPGGFDSFASTGFDQLKIVIDNIANLNPPNWT